MSKPHAQKRPREIRRKAIVLATSEGKIQFADATARRWLKQFFGRPARAGLLPTKVCRWLARHGKAKLPRSLLVKEGDARLYLKRQKSSKQRTISPLLVIIR